MSLFSALFGKSLAECTIDFFGDDSAKVNLTYNGIDPESRDLVYAAIFSGYYAKILYNLGNDPSAELLKSAIQIAAEKIVIANNLDDPKIYVLRMIAGSSSAHEAQRQKILPDTAILLKNMVPHSRRYHVKLTGLNPNIATWTSYPVGNERHFAPLSVLMLYQHIIDQMPFVSIAVSTFSIGAMNHFYSTQLPHTSVKGLALAPTFGLSEAIDVHNRRDAALVAVLEDSNRNDDK